MGKPTLKDKLLGLISAFAWRLFLWGSQTTEEQYWHAIESAGLLHGCGTCARYDYDEDRCLARDQPVCSDWVNAPDDA